MAEVAGSDTWQATVTTIDDLDPLNASELGAAPTDLADRTTYIKNRLDVFSVYAMTGSAIAPGTKFTLSESANVGSFTLSSNEVQVPAAGWYDVSVNVNLASDSATNPLLISLDFNVGGAASVILNRRFSATTGEAVPFNYRNIVQITTPSSQKISVDPSASSGNLTITSGAGIVIKRVG